MSLLDIFKREKDLKWQAKKAGYFLRRLLSLKFTKILLGILFVIILIPIGLYFAYFIFKPMPGEEKTYGVTFSNKYATQLGLDWQDAYIEILDDLGVDNLRLVAYWDEIETTNNEFDYSNIKWQLDEARRRDINVILAMGRKVPRYPECFAPDWWSQIEDREVRQEELLEFLETTVREFDEYENIKMWQVENEPFWPFGICIYEFEFDEFEEEVNLVKSLDNRPILTQDSGEGGTWYKTYSLGDYLGISMYRRIWYDFWHIFGGEFIYFQYPLPHWSYPIKAMLVGVPHEKIIVTELQGEPWGPAINSKLSDEEKDKTMSREGFINTLDYAHKAGFSEFYLWGVEWWLWEKDMNDNAFFWYTAKGLFN